MEEEQKQEMVAPEKALVPIAQSLFLDVAKFEHCQRVGKVFAESTMVPSHFQKNLGNCMIAINLADRLQIDPFMLMQSLYIVHGKPGIEGKLAIALVNGCGRFEPLEFDQAGKGTDSWSCVALAKEKKSGKVLRGPAVTMQMVKDEGWYSKQGSKWKTLPELMFQYRSAMFFARVYCPEVLLGLRTTEEIHDTIELAKQENGSYGVKAKTEQNIDELKQRLGVGTQPPDPDDEIIAGFVGLKTPGLQNWEQMHREKLKGMSPRVKAVFKEKWERVIGELYAFAEGDIQKEPEEPKASGESEEKVVAEGTTEPQNTEPGEPEKMADCPNHDEQYTEAYCKSKSCYDGCPEWETEKDIPL
jgi:hypothetical protein